MCVDGLPAALGYSGRHHEVHEQCGRDDSEEISVQRINIREPDGRLRCGIANTDRLPGLIMRGEEHPIGAAYISVSLSRWRT